MTGWRLGYIAAPVEIAKACDKIQGQFTSGPNSITQRAGIAALLGDLRPTYEMVKKFKERRDKLMQWLGEIPGIICHEPPAAFYVFPDVKAYFGKTTEAGEVINNADDLCMYFLNTAHVSVVTGRLSGKRTASVSRLQTVPRIFKRVSGKLKMRWLLCVSMLYKVDRLIKLIRGVNLYQLCQLY